MINEANYDITYDVLEEDIIIVDKASNSQLAYLKNNSKEDIYTIDYNVHKVVLQINDISKSITIYDNIAP
ncbi:hypothetical protein BU649_03260 [Staphylococcus chromogenes]|uniref:Uncharacterized protein n=2 Tax=Staphylococcus chromogenes TaxID=46126 RepID=A0AAE5W7W8_STACR|nr:hypothetical protein CD151_03275 [Staphylococcus chromogenes]PTF31036.1 hypothetical protein BUY14_05300 [Staphylococcus chromogenes]PTF39707.1 hypothetical protein BUY17_04565 [Staphylococcus chromogenes]PTF43379.1 hypothetical protein BUY11_02895 [Staphylococcus chromogenes]PTF50072.1 hypothetical protein BUY13_01215 [Staphylococcus chromogenes]